MTNREIRECPLADVLAEKLRESKRELAGRWLERISQRVSLEKNKIFPTQDLLDHIPLLIEGVADYLQDPVKEIGADMPVVAKAMELGALRHSQGFDVYQILKEYELLGGILFAFLAEAADEIAEPCEKSELLFCGQRLFKAITIIQQTTTAHFLRLADTKIAEREERLRTFNQTVSHEIKNRIGAILGAGGTLIELPDLDQETRQKLVDVVVRNARTMRDSVENLIALSTTETDTRQHRHIQLPEAAREAAREIRETAEKGGVQIRFGELPAVEVNAAAVELALTNYLSNAVKYADQNKTERFAEVSASLGDNEKGDRELVVRVRDNGRGVPPDMRKHLFERFFRVKEETADIEGTGLGLSIVCDTVASLGGRAWAEFPEGESVFAFSLPCRRKEGDTAPGENNIAKTLDETTPPVETGEQID
jgi:signal transduction histidine kinase